MGDIGHILVYGLYDTHIKEEIGHKLLHYAQQSVSPEGSSLGLYDRYCIDVTYICMYTGHSVIGARPYFLSSSILRR